MQIGIKPAMEIHGHLHEGHRQLGHQRGRGIYGGAATVPGHLGDLAQIVSRQPVDNAFLGSFNGRLRAECLNISWFLSLPDAQNKLNE